MADLPNLPGVRRDISLINPKLYSEFKASRSTENLRTPGSPGFGEEGMPEEESLLSYFEEGSKFGGGAHVGSRILSPFPSTANAYNDISGRYSLVSQKKDRVLKTRSLPYSSTGSLPPFVRQDTKLCRFLAYFTEPATELIEARSRKVEIKVYLEDNTMEIIEPRIENSGQIQGKFLKRHQIFKPMTRISCGGKNVYSIEDMRAGAELDIYNRIYTVVDCDRSTKQYMEEMGMIFGDPLPLPADLYDPKSRPGMSRAATRGTTRSRRKNGFFEYDRKVLRFYGVWDSRNALFGDLIRVKLHYTLADDMMEIVAVSERNNGRDPMLTLLKKSYVMKKIFPGSAPPHPEVERMSTPAIGAARNPPESSSTERPYHWTDLRIGETISVAALNVLLVDADEFTRDFFEGKGMSLGPPIELPEAVYPTVTNEIPPYNGFGSEEDSLQTCKASLIPTAPMKDGMKAKLFQGMILRYKATMHNPKEADKSREFVIQVHLEDDTYQIREPPLRNSGHKGGIFLSRCKLESHDGSKTLQAQDIYLGGKVTILAHEFEVHDCDQYTFKYMEANANLWHYSDLGLVNKKVKAKKEALQRIMVTYPNLASRQIDVDALADLLQKSGLSFVKQEVCTLFRAVDTQRTGLVKMTKMLKYIMDM
eukprot:gene26714-32282_t